MEFTTTYTGYLETYAEAVCVVQACKNGHLPFASSVRPTRKSGLTPPLANGTTYVWKQATIDQYYDRHNWSPNRQAGSFSLYRETCQIYWSENRRVELRLTPGIARTSSHHPTCSLRNETYKFKADGLMRKTTTVTVDNEMFVVYNYYKPEEAAVRLLLRPNKDVDLSLFHVTTTRGACQLCRKHHKKCNKQDNCERCTKRHLTCVYEDTDDVCSPTMITV
ncbi:hypothetical protein BC938DRAFT_471077 [Jimgerdemannia flammicorona]|uniref:Zn(2)-C6 fungal-type domain-containing protein n=1 Tax=Jimgerdemannia flammicorona TaxID=994334 RepID=A0A433Q8Y0_9FUNG|nr:hypothetical protein BC938DRAFT_471077 [Jimgerdemannia flammicorona]